MYHNNLVYQWLRTQLFSIMTHIFNLFKISFKNTAA